MAGLDLDAGVHRSRQGVSLAASLSGRSWRGGRRGGADAAHADRHQRRRHGTPPPRADRAIRDHDQPPLRWALHPRAGQRREGELCAVRLRLRSIGEPLRRGAPGHPPALDFRWTRGFRWSVLPPPPRTPRRRTIRRPHTADLDRRERAAHVGAHREIRGWLVAHGQRRSRGIRCQAGRRPTRGGACEARSDEHRAGQDDRVSARRAR